MGKLGHIVIVDDDEIDRLAIRRLMPESYHTSFEIVELETGEELLEFCRRAEPICVFLDYLLPGMNGLEVLDRLSAEDRLENLDIVILTGGGDEEVAAKAFKKGAFDYLVKNKISAAELAITIQNAMQRRAVSRQSLSVRQQLDAALDKASRITHDYDELVSTMAHELRSPLTSIVGLTQILMDSSLTAKQSAQIMTIEQSGQYSLDLVDRLLSYYDRRSGARSAQNEVFTIESAFESVRSIQALDLLRRGVALEAELPDEARRPVRADRGCLEQILLNLISNASKFTPAGGTITVSALPLKSAGGDEITIQFCVRDTGIGIPKDRLEAIFNAFAQADGATKQRYGGTGLGLSIVANLVSLMDGRVWCESLVGEGSSFYFTLPFRTADSDGAVSTP